MRISDWSSDVCSSDLAQVADVLAQGQLAVDVLVGVVGQRRIAVELGDQLVDACLEAGAVFLRPPVDVVAGAVELAALVVEAVPGLVYDNRAEIGRAPCRDRGWQDV